MKYSTLEAMQALRDQTDSFAELQQSNGALLPPMITEGEKMLTTIDKGYSRLCREMGGHAVGYAELFQQDIEMWQAGGLDIPPNFLSTHDNWNLLDNPGEITPFIGPVRVPNNPRSGDFVLTFAAAQPYRPAYPQTHEVINYATRSIPNPKDINIIDASVRSNSYSQGDGSVLFSELIASENRAGPQTFGAFIINDFSQRYQARTVEFPDLTPSTRSLLAEVSLPRLEDERSIWLQVHDRFHDIGGLPHAENLKLKMKFAAAVLDELKADSHAFLALSEINDTFQRVASRQIIDKALRFPFSPYASSSVDGAVGEVFLRKLQAGGALEYTNKSIAFHQTAAVESITEIATKALEVEEESHPSDYLAMCVDYLQVNKVAASPSQRKMLAQSALYSVRD